MLINMTKAQYDKHMKNTFKLYREFDEAIEKLRNLAREFGPGADDLFEAQLAKCQQMRIRLVMAENLEDIDESGNLLELP